MIDLGGTLYGTTANGGATYDRGQLGFGTVFSVSLSGTEKVLHSFGLGSDGGEPEAGLTDVGGTLYGTQPQVVIPRIIAATPAAEPSLASRRAARSRCYIDSATGAMALCPRHH